VSLNGAVRCSPESPVHLERDRIEVDGHVVRAHELVYLAMNKPRGLITTASDEKGRDTIYSLIEKTGTPWLAPVGRLDKASEGLLLLTNDSEWGARLASPGSHLDKTYHVQIDRIATADEIDSLVQGVRQDGELLRAKRVRLLRAGAKNCWLEIVLDEGRNRQIRRIIGSLGIEVLRLVRVAIGTLALGNLAKGMTRPLSREEKASIDRASQQHPENAAKPARPKSA